MKNDNQHTNPDLNGENDQQRLLDYLKGQMDNRTAHAFEKDAADDPFMRDAMEGLDLVDKKTNIEHVVGKLNRKLKKRLNIRRKKSLHGYKEIWLYVAIVILLLLVVVAFVVIKRTMG